MSAFSPHPNYHLSFSLPPSVPVPTAASSSTTLQGQEIIIQPPCRFPLSPIYPNKTTHEVPQHSGSQLLCNSNVHKHCVIKAPADYYSKHSVAPHSHCSPSPMVVVELDDQSTRLEEKTKRQRKFMSCKVAKEGKCKGEDESDCSGGKKRMTKGGKRKASEKVMPTTASAGYVSVRARRGEATDSHSLAERVRREKISQKMRLLQSLVPGCDKITGKTLILDEIINYVQSLHNQVEFLTMKIASFYPMSNDLGLATPASEDFYNIGSSSQCVPETDRDQLINATAISQEWPEISTSSLLQLENPCNFLSQDTGNYLREMEDQTQSIANAGEFNSFYHSF